MNIKPTDAIHDTEINIDVAVVFHAEDDEVIVDSVLVGTPPIDIVANLPQRLISSLSDEIRDSVADAKEESRE